MIDLTLVHINDLIEEVFNRCECAVLAYYRTIDAGEPCIFISYTGESTLGKLGLCDMAKDKIQREFNETAEDVEGT